MKEASRIREEVSVPGEAYASGYPEGNLERFGFTVTVYSPQAWTLLMKTIDPMIYAALIELLGNNMLFQKRKGTIIPVLDATQCATEWQVCLEYYVPDFIGFSGEPQAIAKDQQYIVNKLVNIPNVTWKPDSAKINTATGLVSISFTMPVGYK